jgi:hypothetical protein
MAVKSRLGRKAKRSGGDAGYPLIDFAFITALEIERVAVCNTFKLKPKHRIRKGSRVYWQGRVPLKDGEYYEIVVARPSGGQRGGGRELEV